jgi:hypothetical protein
MSAAWGRGWQVGINKAIDQHERALSQAAEILAEECGTLRTRVIGGQEVTFGHKLGDRPDLCPKCKRAATSAGFIA